MRIAFFGSSLVSAYWNGAATYYRGIIRALHELGHVVTFYEPDAYGRQQNRDMDDPEWATVVVYAPSLDGDHQAIEAAHDADLIVKASGVGVFDELLEDALVGLKTAERNVVFWDVDAPATLDRIHNNPDDPLKHLIPKYDAVFTYGGGDPVVLAYRRLGARQCIPIYNALDVQTHHPVPAVEQYRGDLAFLGNRLPDRESRVEEFFLKPATALPSFNFVLGGAGWQDKPMTENVRYVGHVFTPDHNAFNCSSLAVLNVSRESMARYGFSPATRVFEAAGSASCIITDCWEGIEMFFEPDTEILVARNGAQVCDVLQTLDAARARKIGQAAYRHVLARHTYKQRAEQVESILQGAFTTSAGVTL